MNLVDALLHDKTDAAETALVTDGETWSYRQLAASVNRFGNALRALGAAPDARVLFAARDTPNLVAALLGAMKVGAVAVVASTRASVDDLAQIVSQSQPSLIVCDPPFLDTCRQGAGRAGSPVVLLCSAGSAAVQSSLSARAATCSDRLLATPRGPGDEAFWVCSSGSTGTPKGVVHTHRVLHRACTAFHQDTLGLRRGDRVFCTSKLSFAYTLGNALLAPLQLGLAVVLEADWATPERTLEIIDRHAPRAVFSTPSLYRAMLNCAASARLAHVAHFVSAGEHLPEAVSGAWRQLTGRGIANCYGCSETVFLALASEPGESTAGSVGKPLPGVDVRIEPLPDDSSGSHRGMLHLQHPFLAIRYGSEATPGGGRLRDGWLATGDVFEIDDSGCWHHRGRTDDLVKIAGQWVYVCELEEIAVVQRGVAEAAAVTARDADGMIRLGLFVVPDHGEDAAALLAAAEQQLAERLPRYKRPRWLRAVASLPRTTTGKIQRARLRQWIEQAPS